MFPAYSTMQEQQSVTIKVHLKHPHIPITICSSTLVGVLSCALVSKKPQVLKSVFTCDVNKSP